MSKISLYLFIVLTAIICLEGAYIHSCKTEIENLKKDIILQEYQINSYKNEVNIQNEKILEMKKKNEEIINSIYTDNKKIESNEKSNSNTSEEAITWLLKKSKDF